MKKNNSHKNTYLGGLIIDALLKNGKTQKYLAEQLGISQAAISNIVRGISKPSAKRLKTISKVLNVNLDDIVLAISLDREKTGYEKMD